MPRNREAIQRYAKYFSSELKKIAQQFEKGDAETLAALFHFDTEKININNAQHTLETLSDRDFEENETLIEFLINTSSILNLRMNPEQRITSLLIGKDVAHQLGKEKYEARILRYLGSAYYLIGDYEASLRFFERSAEIFREIGQFHSQSITLSEMGLTLLAMKKYREAISTQKIALEIATKFNDTKLQGRILGNLGMSYCDIGELETAADLHEKRIYIAQNIGDVRGRANGEYNLSKCLLGLNKNEEALQHLETALIIYRILGDIHGETKTLWAMGKFFEQSGNLEKALRYMEASQHINQTGKIETLTKRKKRIEMIGNLLQTGNQ